MEGDLFECDVEYIDDGGVTTYSTEDIQYDLAMSLYDKMQWPDSLWNNSLIIEYTAELRRRGAPLPKNPLYIYNCYKRFGRELIYDLEG